MRSLILCALAAAPLLPIAACVSNSNPSSPPDDAGPAADASADTSAPADASPSADSAAPAASAPSNGLYFGTATDGGTASHVAVLLTDAGYWVWQYGTNDVTAGAVGSDTNSDGMLFTVQAYASTPSLEATAAPGQSINGTLGDDAGLTAFQATYATAYGTPASLSSVVGAWSSQVYSGSYGDEAEVITITSTGSLTMNNPLGCIATGTITPDPTYGFYELTATFSGGDCIAGSQALTGVAVVDTSNAGAPQLLTSIVTSAHDIDFPSWGTFSPDGG
jgi:hypothetical protein